MPQQIKKILIIAPAWIGDMVMAHTLLQFLRQHYPHAQIDVLAPRATQALIEFMPEVNKLIPFDTQHKEFGLWKRIKFGLQLRKEKYDQAILLPNSWKSALVPFFAGIPKRTGWLGEQRYILLNDYRRLDKQRYNRIFQRFAALAFPAEASLPELPYPRLVVDKEKLALTLNKLVLTKPSQPLLALCPGAEFGPTKRWPAEYYAEVAQKKLQEGWQVWLFGSPKEIEAGDIIQQYTNNQCVNLIGKTTLPDAINLLSLADVVVANDSGLMHTAAALRRPLIAIYGATPPDLAPPLTDKKQMLYMNLTCSPCFQRECPLQHLNCLKQLMPTQVLSAMKTLVDSK